MKFILIFLSCLFITSPAPADDKDLEEILDENTPLPAGYYSPEFCDFEITFPEKPVTSRRCPEGTGKCYQISGFTYVYDMQTTVDVTAQCTRSTPKNFTQYNDAVIKAVLNGMVKRANIEQFDINVREVEENKIRQGSLLGTG